MRPVKITIPGKFWDSQLYSGKLYLFDMDGALHYIDWDSMLYSYNIPERLQLPFECAFLRGDLLYGDKWTAVFKDFEIRELITRKFELLADDQDRTPYKIFMYGRKQDSPFPFPHTDSAIFKKTMYVASRSGLHKSECQKLNGNPVSQASRRCWDCPVLSVTAAYSTLALASGSEGLWELPIERIAIFGNSPIYCIEEKHCEVGNWTYFSIFGSSHVESGFLAAYDNSKSEFNVIEERNERHRIGTMTGEQLFGERGYSWGYKNRLCLASKSHVHVLKYNPFHKDGTLSDHIEDLGHIEIEPPPGDVISGMIAPFGIVIEYDNALMVVPSDGSTPTILPGEPVNWRVFPRSKYYQNQLHVIYDDRLEVWSFNHDYFVDQKEKIAGTWPEFKMAN